MPKKKTSYELYQEYVAKGSEIINSMQKEYDRISADYEEARQKLLDDADKAFFKMFGVTIDKALGEDLICDDGVHDEEENDDMYDEYGDRLPTKRLKRHKK